MSKQIKKVKEKEQNATNSVLLVSHLGTFLDDLKTKILNGLQTKIPNFLVSVTKNDTTQVATFTTNTGSSVEIPYGDQVYTSTTYIKVDDATGEISLQNIATDDDIHALFN